MAATVITLLLGILESGIGTYSIETIYLLSEFCFVCSFESVLGPFHTGDKVVYLDKFFVIANILQVQMVCPDLTNFDRGRQIFKCTADKICLM